MTQQITINKEEYDLMLKTLKEYKEYIDTFEAIEIAEKEKGQYKKLNSLADFMD